MVKLLALLLPFFLFANALEEVLINMMGEKFYQINYNFVDRLFLKKPYLFQKSEGNIDYYKVIKVLKENGLLHLSFYKPTEIKIGFKARTKPILLTKAINNVLSTIGYSYFTISKAKYTNGNMFLTFFLVAENSIDPAVILGEFKKRGIEALRVVRKNQTDWLYELDMTYSKVIDSMPLQDNDHLEVKSISGEYWFATKKSGMISILKKNPKIGWSPRIVLFDKDLQILEIITQNDFTASVEVNITEKTAYLMVTDLNSPARLKNGIVVTFEAFGVEK